MDARQPEDSFVDAGAFFRNNVDAESVLQSNISAVNVSTRSSLRSKANVLDASSVQTRRRSQRFAAIENNNDDSNILIGAVMSPATSSGIASKREATRFPSVMFPNKTPAATQANISSPLPGPKSNTSSYVSTKRTIRKEEEEESAASGPTVQQLPQFNRTSVASELYQSATSHLSTSTDDLSSLQNALKALKSSSLSSNATKNAVVSATAIAPAPAPAYVPLPKPASRRPSAKPFESSSLDSLQQRVARMNMANIPASLHEKAAVASPKIERYSPIGNKARAPQQHDLRAGTPAKQKPKEESRTPPMRSLPQTPGAPANTPASPLPRTSAGMQQLRQRYDANRSNNSGLSPAQIEAALAAKYQLNQEGENKDEHLAVAVTAPAAVAALDLQNLPSEEATVLMASPLPTIPTTTATIARTTTCVGTNYDGDEDVVMGDMNTPGTGAGSIAAMATTVPRRVSFSAVNENNSDHSSGGGANSSDSRSSGSGVRRSSRFKVEALRQGVTPLRVRQHRASFSPSNAGVNVEIESAKKSTETEKKEEEESSPTMSSNPLALHPVLPLAAAPGESSPAVSSNSAISNNPLFAGTPSHPTPPSITTRRPSLGMAAAAGLRTPSTGGASAASEGIKLAEKLHAAAEKLQTPVTAVTYTGNKKRISATSSISITSDEDATFQFKGDVQALLEALDANTPQQENNDNKPSTPAAAGIGMPTARALAAASTEERPKPVARRHSSLSATPNSGGAAILDLAGFDEDGERTAPGQETPLLAPRGGTKSTDTLDNASASHGTTRFAPPSVVTRSSLALAEAAAASRPSSVPALEVASLRQKIADLESERNDAASLLSGYQGTIAELQDRHSAAIIKLQAENAMLKSESERLRSGRAQIHSQFDTLYREKYAPLKIEAAALRRGADALRTRLAEEGGHVKRIAQLEAELSASQAAIAAAQQGAAAFKIEAEAAKESERLAEQRAFDAGARLQELETKWATKFAAESSRAEQALVRKESEVSAWKDKHAAMARQYDDAVHRAHLAQAARERKVAEVGRKEEEICTLQVELQGYESALRQYRAENDKFAASKETYKARIAALEKELVEKEAEKQSLAALVDGLLQK
ncbi:hypothetical protein Ndes2437B_g03050 [Nannochloris sp. 'desiccata']